MPTTLDFNQTEILPEDEAVTNVHDESDPRRGMDSQSRFEDLSCSKTHGLQDALEFSEENPCELQSSLRVNRHMGVFSNSGQSKRSSRV